MNIRFVLLMCLFKTLALAVYAQKKEYQVTAIAFYNFENLFDAEDDPHNRGDDDFLPSGPYQYTTGIYHQKLHNLATVIRQLGTDFTPDGPAIIGTAEIENDKVLSDLIQQPEIKDRGYKFVHFESPDSRGIDVALLYNPSYFKVLYAKPLPVIISASGEKIRRGRDVLWVSGVLLGDTIHVFVNHWPSRRGGEAATAPLRAAAASVSKRVIDSMMALNPHTKAIIMGDLNDDPTSESVTKVLGAKGNKEKIALTDLYNPFIHFYKNGIGTLAYDDRWSLFDQIMVTGALLQPSVGWRFYRAEVFNKAFLRSAFGRYKGYPHRSFAGNNWINGYSDHFPAMIYLIKDCKIDKDSVFNKRYFTNFK